MNVKNNKDELRAKQYLQTLNYSKIEYEPLGNVTPDFLLDRKIAVEVRRLNRNYIDTEQLINIENFELHLIKDIKQMIESFDLESFENSAYISLTLYEPLDIETEEHKDEILAKIEATIKNHANNISESKTYKINDKLHITFTPACKAKTLYIYNGCNGDISWITNKLHKNIQSVIDEKDKKIEQNFKLYREWWLILVDSIMYGLDKDDFIELKKINPDKRKFSKVIIISPKGELKTFEF